MSFSRGLVSFTARQGSFTGGPVSFLAEKISFPRGLVSFTTRQGSFTGDPVSFLAER